MSRVPECRFMMAHAGGQPFAKGDWNRAIMAAQQYENLYLETASSTIDTNSSKPRGGARPGEDHLRYRHAAARSLGAVDKNTRKLASRRKL